MKRFASLIFALSIAAVAQNGGNNGGTPVVSISSPASGASFTAPANITVSASASVSGGTITEVQFFQGSTLIGTATSSPYSITWSNVAAGTYSLTAKATDSAGASGTSGVISITVNSASNTQYQGYLDLANCSAIAGWAWNADQPSTDVSVNIYNGTTLIATAVADLFRSDLQAAGIGNGDHAFSIATPASILDGNPHTISAEFAGTSTSLSTSPKTVTCPPPGGTIQGYKVNSSLAQFTSPGATITVNGTSTFGPSVDPYALSVAAGANTVASSTPAGYAVAYSECVNCTDHTSAGGHPFVAGNSVTVNVPSGGSVDLWWQYTATGAAPPTVSLTSPASGASFNAPATITLDATTSDSDGTVTSVAFFASGTLIGTATSAPFSITWSNVAAGTYSVTAVATDSNGLSGTSSPITVTVNAVPVDFSTPRANNLGNRTGSPGEDLLSGNYKWSVPIVSLKGRAGLDLDLALTYNSLVWIKSGSSIEFNPDQGFPGPGFQLGFPVIQPQFLDSAAGVNSYMIIMPSGVRVEARQVGTSNVYESADSSYIQLTNNGAAGLALLMPNGTQMTYQFQVSEYMCTQVKDRNGNFITISYSGGQMSSIVDTLGRTITFNYNSNNTLASITQLWSGVTHTWASFTYGTATLQTNFNGLTLVGATNGQSLTVPTQVTLADGSSYNFTYNSWGQVYRVGHVAAAGNELSHVVYNLPLTNSVAQSDCPRFTQKNVFAENWNNNAEAITTFVFDPAGLTGGQVTTPDGTIFKESYFNSTWQTGLVSQTQFVSGGVVEAATSLTYTQDNASLAYLQNPRVTQMTTSDNAGSQRSTVISYQPVTLPNGANLSLPTDVQITTGAGALLKHIHTDYVTASIYLNSNILGLSSDVLLYDGNNNLAGEITFQYDTGTITDEGASVHHDETNFGSGFVQGRGNVTSIQQLDITGVQSALVSTMAYDAVGNVILSSDPAGHQTKTSYSDAFTAGTAPGLTLAFATSVTDPDNFTSTSQYDYDNGEVLLTQNPIGAQQIYTYDSIGRLLQQTYNDSVLGQTGTHTRYTYSSTMDQLQIFKLLDSGELLTTQSLDGAGRLIQTLTSFPGSTGGFRGQQFTYDVMGRPLTTSNPTEVNSSFTPSGDDASGFVSTSQSYDWEGRPTGHINQDGTSSQVTYVGCTCAGGGSTTITDEVGRKSITSYDALGRASTREDLNSGGSIFRTSTTTYDGLDDILSMALQGSNGTSITLTRTYDGFGRMLTEHTPAQKSSAMTTYSYNPDGTTASVTDARGAVTNYGYDGRGLPTVVSYIKVDGTPDTSLAVNFAYDGAGNRILMTDNAGVVNYTYNTAGQLTNETRTFNAVSGTFPLSYTYDLIGQLTSVTDPFGGVVTYTYDAAGQLAGVAGSGKGSVPTYVSSQQYRAWGGVKQIAYGNNASASYQYNSRMNVAGYNVVDPSGVNFMGSTFAYYPDSLLQTIADINPALDASFTYDQVARLSTAFTGSNSTLGASSTGPYQLTLAYDAFDNMLTRGEQIWTAGDNSYSTQYVNNRNTAWTYDAQGNPLQTETTTFVYNAGDQQQSSNDPTRTISGVSIPFTIDQNYDGDGFVAIQTVNGTATYFLRSSVLGQTISQVASDGTKTAGYVYANNQLLAERLPSSGVTQLQWVHRNPATNSEGHTLASGPGVPYQLLDPLADVLPLQNPGAVTFQSPDQLYPLGGDITDLSGGCTLDDVAINCGVLAGLVSGDEDAFDVDITALDPFDRTWYAMMDRLQNGGPWGPGMPNQTTPQPLDPDAQQSLPTDRPTLLLRTPSAPVDASGLNDSTDPAEPSDTIDEFPSFQLPEGSNAGMVIMSFERYTPPDSDDSNSSGSDGSNTSFSNPAVTMSMSLVGVGVGWQNPCGRPDSMPCPDQKKKDVPGPVVVINKKPVFRPTPAQKSQFLDDLLGCFDGARAKRLKLLQDYFGISPDMSQSEIRNRAIRRAFSGVFTFPLTFLNLGTFSNDTDYLGYANTLQDHNYNLCGKAYINAIDNGVWVDPSPNFQ